MKKLFTVLVCAVAVSHCGKDRKEGDSAAPEQPASAETKDTTVNNIPNRVDGTTDEQKTKIQLSEEAIGIKTGPQIIAHFSQVTGISTTDFSENELKDLSALKKALPEKNSLESFSAAHPPAALKVATLYCIKLVDFEQKIQDGQGGGRLSKLPAVDYASQKPMSIEVARIFYAPLISLFGGLDTVTLPDKNLVEPAFDRLVNGLRNLPNPPNGRPLGVKSYVVGMCTAAATSLITLWI